MRTLPLQSLVRLSGPGSRADPVASADPATGMPGWLALHQDTATEILDRIRHGPVPAHAPVLAERGPTTLQDQHRLVKQRLALLPPSTGRSGAGPTPIAASVASSRPRASPSLPELVVMRPPTDDYVPLVEFMLLLRGLGIRKMVVLGDLSERWAKDRDSTPSTYMTVIPKSAVSYRSSEASPLGPGWRRQIHVEWEHPPLDSPSNAPADVKICDGHSVEQLQVACGTPGTLGPGELRCAADWILRNSQPAERVVLLGRDDQGVSTSPDTDPLLAMSGQLALTLALRLALPQGLAATAEPASADPFYRHQQRLWLQNAGSDLHQRDPALLGGPVHLAATLAASDPLSNPLTSAPVHSRAA